MKAKKIIASLAVAVCLTSLLGTPALARQVQFYNVSVSGHRSSETGSALKTVNNSPFRISLDSSMEKSNVRATMHNSNHASRGSGTVSLGSTVSITNNATKGYNYHLSLEYTNILAGSGVITGYWSPDAPQ